MNSNLKVRLTFGIVTSKQSQHFLIACVRSIIELSELKPSEFEIIIVGGENVLNQLRTSVDSFNEFVIKSVPFNETVKNGWITKKKNLITENSNGDVIVYCHDYLIFDKNWYEEWNTFGWNWDIGMNRIETHIRDRAVDWMGLPTDKKYGNVLLPYDYNNPKGMYIPGNFWLSKREIMIKYPLDENLVWGQAEDIEWSKRVLGGNSERNEWLRNMTHKSLDEEIDESDINTVYKCNPKSIVRYNKPAFTSPDFKKEYDLHSGDNSRPIGFKREDYDYLKYRK